MTVNITFNGSSYNVLCDQDGRVALADILAKFATKIDMSQFFSRASLSDCNDSTNKLLQDKKKYFTCCSSGQYILNLNAPATIVSTPFANLVSPSAAPLAAISPISHRPVSMRTLSVSRAPKADTSTIIDNAVDLEIAMILSSLAYSPDPLSDVSSQFPYSTNDGYSRAVAELSEPECGLKYAKNAPNPYLMAVSKRYLPEAERKENTIVQSTLWIAFPGTKDKWDVLADLTPYQWFSESGCIHAGFLKRSKTMPHDFFRAEFERCKYDRMIFTGHSLGGAVAHICAEKQLSHTSSQTGTQIYSIAFGAPLIGDGALEKSVRRRKLSNRFLTVVNEQDAVPGLLLVSMTAKKLQRVIEENKSVFDIVSKLVELFTNFVFGDWMNWAITLFKQVLPELKKCIKSFFNYVPFGTYVFLQLDSPGEEKKPVTESSEIIRLIIKISNDAKAYTYSNIADHFFNNYVNSLYYSSICTRVKPVLPVLPQTIRNLERNCSPQIENIAIVVDKYGESLEIKITGSGVSCISGLGRDQRVSLIIYNPEEMKKWEIQKSAEQIKWTARMKRPLSSHARITVGTHYIDLKTHFDPLHCLIDSNNVKMIDEPNYKVGAHLNANMLYGSLLRACFAFLHDTENPHKKMIKNKHLMAMRQLIQECNSESDSTRFKDIFLQDPQAIGELSYYDKLHQQMPSVVFALYESLVQNVNYKFIRGYVYSGLCFAAGIATLAVVGSNPVGWAAAGVCTAGSLYFGYQTMKERQYYGVENRAYEKNLKLVASFIGVSIAKCTDESMFEMEIIKKLDKHKVPENIAEITEIPQGIFMVKYQHLDEKMKALRFARKTTLIHGLRLSMSKRIYVTFVNAGKKNQLLTTVWKIPSSELRTIQVECYPLTVRQGEYELVILLLPTLTNLSDTIQNLKQYYTIEPQLCAIVSSAEDSSKILSYPSASDLRNANSSALPRSLAVPSQLRQTSIIDARRTSRQRLQSISKPAPLRSTIKSVTIKAGDRSMAEVNKKSDNTCLVDSTEIDNKEKIVSFLNKHLREAINDKNFNVKHYEYCVQSPRPTE